MNHMRFYHDLASSKRGDGYFNERRDLESKKYNTHSYTCLEWGILTNFSSILTLIRERRWNLEGLSKLL